MFITCTYYNGALILIWVADLKDSQELYSLLVQDYPTSCQGPHARMGHTSRDHRTIQAANHLWTPPISHFAIHGAHLTFSYLSAGFPGTAPHTITPLPPNNAGGVGGGRMGTETGVTRATVARWEPPQASNSDLVQTPSLTQPRYVHSGLYIYYGLLRASVSLSPSLLRLQDLDSPAF